MKDDELVTATIAELNTAFQKVNFHDPREYHWKVFIETLLRLVRRTEEDPTVR